MRKTDCPKLRLVRGFSGKKWVENLYCKNPRGSDQQVYKCPIHDCFEFGAKTPHETQFGTIRFYKCAKGARKTAVATRRQVTQQSAVRQQATPKNHAPRFITTMTLS
jgi:hypothetical protein